MNSTSRPGDGAWCWTGPSHGNLDGSNRGRDTRRSAHDFGRSSRDGGVAAFRIASLVAVIVPVAGALLTPSVGVARGVALTFALAAATFCPLLLLGIWWRRLTAYGATAGLVTPTSRTVVPRTSREAGASRCSEGR